jgi:two-component system, NarL family, sensor histidine kinase DesK
MVTHVQQAGGRASAAGGAALSVVAAPFRPALPWGVLSRPESVVSPSRGVRPGLLMRLTPAGVAAYCTVFPLLQIVEIAASNHGYSRAAWALAATAAYVPLYLRHVMSFARLRRPRGAAWTLAAMTVIIAGAVPLAGGWWLPSFVAVAVCLLITWPWRWSLPGVAALVIAQVPLAMAFPAAEWPDPPDSRPPFFALTLVWRTAAVFVPVWLAGAVRQLEAARQELADDAVLGERLRVDSRLRETLGAALASIAAGGRRSAALAADGAPGAASMELAALAETSRGALADARQLLRGLHQPSAWAELETAASLLTSAGIQTRLALPAGGPPAEVSAEFRSALQLVIARLLRDDAARTCLLAVSSAGGQVQLDIQVDSRHLATVAVSPS